MLKIDNRQVENQIKEILQNTNFASPDQYLTARVSADYKAIKQKKKLDL